MVRLLKIAGLLVEDAFRWVLLLFRSAEALRVENLFLRRQLALYIERGGRPRRVDAATRISLALMARLFDWRGALVVVQPATMIRWHRAGWRLFWRMKSDQSVSSHSPYPRRSAFKARPQVRRPTSRRSNSERTGALTSSLVQKRPASRQRIATNASSAPSSRPIFSLMRAQYVWIVFWLT